MPRFVHGCSALFMLCFHQPQTVKCMLFLKDVYVMLFLCHTCPAETEFGNCCLLHFICLFHHFSFLYTKFSVSVLDTKKVKHIHVVEKPARNSCKKHLVRCKDEICKQNCCNQDLQMSVLCSQCSSDLQTQLTWLSGQQVHTVRTNLFSVSLF